MMVDINRMRISNLFFKRICITRDKVKEIEIEDEKIRKSIEICY